MRDPVFEIEIANVNADMKPVHWGITLYAASKTVFIFDF